MDAKPRFSPQARKAGQAARAANMDKRRKLADKHNLRPSDFFRDVILDTIKQHNIPISTIPTVLLPESQELEPAVKTNGKGKWESIPLGAIPDRPEKPVKKLTKSVQSSDNTQVILRMLDLIERLL